MHALYHTESPFGVRAQKKRDSLFFVYERTEAIRKQSRAQTLSNELSLNTLESIFINGV